MFVLNYAGRRLVGTLGVLLGASVIVFILVHLVPGDAAQAILGPAASPEGVAALRRELGLDRPLLAQYVDWLGRVIRGDLGMSVALRKPVIDELAEKTLNTWILAGASMVLAVGAGLGIGTLSGLRPGTWWDKIARHGTVMIASTPAFWLGLVAVYVFAIRLRLLPAVGKAASGAGLGLQIRHVVLPAIATATFSTAIIARTVRGALLDVKSQPFVVAARARGLPEHRIFLRHISVNMLPTTASIVGLQIAYLFSGVIFTEVVFAWPGLGQLMFSSISARDLPMIQAVTLVIAVQFVFINFLADLVRVGLDPRART